jgi:hypothetical protein
MGRHLLLFLTLLALVASASATATATQPAHSKRQAEVNVLRIVASTWSARRLPGLVNPRTRLLADDTEAICHSRGRRRAGDRYSRFVCVVRPHVHTARQGLYLNYRAQPRSRFNIRWLAYHLR